MTEKEMKLEENMESLAVSTYPTAISRLDRNGSLSSLTFYNESSVQETKPKSWSQENILVQDPVTFSMKQSARLPVWAWLIIAKCLGIPQQETGRPVIGTVLHILTFASALIYGVSHLWFETYAIISIHKREDVLKRCVSIFMVIIWCALGFYAKRLNARLFKHPSFLKDIRMHAKTVFKMNAALLLFLLGALFVSVNNYNNFDSSSGESCIEVETHPAVCIVRYSSRVIFSVFMLVWNSLVGAVLVSVCRTHTIGIRRFIRELERDALIQESYRSQLFQDTPLTREDICQETLWLDEEQSDEEVHIDEGHNTKKEKVHAPSPSKTCLSKTEASEISLTIQNDPIYNRQESVRSQHYYCSCNSEKNCSPVVEQKPGLQTPDNISVSSNPLSSAVILRNYWKISCRLRLTGIALQRWVASFTSLVIVWCASLLVSWLSSPASVYEVIEFVVPLALLLLICAAIAEVNVEGTRMLKCICPTKERLQMMNYLIKNPLQLTTFGFPISYGTISTVVLAILVAFTSRLVILEINT